MSKIIDKGPRMTRISTDKGRTKGAPRIFRTQSPPIRVIRENPCHPWLNVDFAPCSLPLRRKRPLTLRPHATGPAPPGDRHQPPPRGLSLTISRGLTPCSKQGPVPHRGQASTHNPQPPGRAPMTRTFPNTTDATRSSFALCYLWGQAPLTDRKRPSLRRSQ
jgi:hypothetical protein